MSTRLPEASTPAGKVNPNFPLLRLATRIAASERGSRLRRFSLAQATQWQRRRRRASLPSLATRTRIAAQRLPRCKRRSAQATLDWLNACTRAITSADMPPAPRNQSLFKRQIVFRIDSDDWPLLEQAAAEHGSIQAALIAALHALTNGQPSLSRRAHHEAPRPVDAAAREERARDAKEEEEITAREAARILGLKRDTVAGYIRSGRLPGRYDGAPTWRGWVTNRSALPAYRQRVHGTH